MCKTIDEVGIPQSPGFEPRGYHVFMHLKKFLGGRSLRGDQETKDVAHDWLKFLVATFCRRGIQNVVSLYECLTLHGDCVEW